MTVCDECGALGGLHTQNCSMPRNMPSQAEQEYVNAQKALLAKLRQHDAVNHPSHYTAYKGVEVIDLTEQMNFNRGNAVKYIARAGLKDPERTVEDLEKAKWYISREIDRISKEG